MGERELTRRKLLAGAAGAGGLGALVGPGTASLFSDTERAQGSSLQSGQLDLLVSWETGDGSTGTSENGRLPDTLELTSEDSSGTIDLTLSLPPDDGANNAALVWVGTDCPADTDLHRDIEVELRLRYCDDCLLYEGSLWGLVQGVFVDPTGLHPNLDDGCLVPGRQLPLELEISVDDFEGTGDVEIPLRFIGTQCRNARHQTNPFVPLDEECTPPPDGSTRGIGAVAFCSQAGEDVLPTISTRRTNDSGEPTSVEWNTELPVDYVVITAGTQFTVYDYRDDAAKSGTATVGADGPSATTLAAPPWYSSEPCALPATELDHEEREFASSTKYEPGDDGVWEVER